MAKIQLSTCYSIFLPKPNYDHYFTFCLRMLWTLGYFNNSIQKQFNTGDQKIEKVKGNITINNNCSMLLYSSRLSAFTMLEKIKWSVWGLSEPRSLETRQHNQTSCVELGLRILQQYAAGMGTATRASLMT